MTKPKVHIWTDGSGNADGAGYAAVLIHHLGKKVVFGPVMDPHPTNNKGELMGPIRGLELLKKPCDVIVHSDSQYVCKGFNWWLKNWKLKNWHNASGKPTKNVEYWKRLEKAAGPHTVVFKWVRGHAGVSLNELADELADIGKRSLVERTDCIF